MRKENMVTRIMEITVVEAMLVEVENAEVKTMRLSILGDYDDETALKRTKAEYETDTLKVVTVKVADHYTQLMGMTETLFYEMAEILPDR